MKDLPRPERSEAIDQEESDSPQNTNKQTECGKDTVAHWKVSVVVLGESVSCPSRRVCHGEEVSSSPVSSRRVVTSVHVVSSVLVESDHFRRVKRKTFDSFVPFSLSTALFAAYESHTDEVTREMTDSIGAAN